MKHLKVLWPLFLFALILGSVDAQKKRTKPVPLTRSQKSVARAALKPLLRLESAVKAGLTFDDYSKRYVDTQVEVDEKLRALPNSEVKRNFTLALVCYKLARSHWESAQDSNSQQMSNIWANLRQGNWADAAKHTRAIEKALK